MKQCAICNKKVEDLIWVNDQYGIPYKGVCCESCAEIADSQLADYINDDDPDCMLGWD
ncbi:hypothetical protein [Vallitalea guaymasensis]|uniref:hypothetical protein n=1 Tax=Vallitalea guaymasensis TaxID=1185412 RepID=UPI00187D671E|nr:hypothetical protein [Vallitalea guaymasensis]